MRTDSKAVLAMIAIANFLGYGRITVAGPEAVESFVRGLLQIRGVTSYKPLRRRKLLGDPALCWETKGYGLED